jgi:chromosome segregation ATPase
MKPVIIILTIVSLGLALALLVQHRKADEQLQALKSDVHQMTVERDATRSKLEETEKVATRLETDLAKRTQELTSSTENLTKVNADYTKAQAEAAAAKAELEKQATRIAQLEGQRDDLNKKADDLGQNISSLETQIAETKRKLASSEGDRTFLLGQLKKLETDRNQLVAQLNDIGALKKQISKLRDEAAVSQRLAWIRSGLYQERDKKGAERLLAASPKVVDPNNKVIMEIDQKGNSKVTTPSPVTPSAVVPANN